MIGKFDDYSGFEDFFNRIFANFAGKLVYNVKNIREWLTKGIGIVPTRQTLRHAVHKNDFPSNVGGDDPIANTLNMAFHSDVELIVASF
jgi:hypothetical protein